MTTSKILVIGDCHVHDADDLERFDLASTFIAQHRPDIIVIIGDFLTLNCLSAWDRDKRKRMEGRRYRDELERGNEALDRLTHSISTINKKSILQKKRKYDPVIQYVEGNHEDRLTRYLEYDPTFEGTVSIQKDLCLDERGIAWTPYREYFYHNGLAFTHIPHNTVKPISGKYHVFRTMDNTVQTVIYGHTHKFETACRHVPGMPHLQQVLSSGCFFEDHEEYVHGLVTHYWKGLMLLHNYSEGRFDLETYSLGRLRRIYVSV